jgi:hypothetical protein
MGRLRASALPVAIALMVGAGPASAQVVVNAANGRVSIRASGQTVSSLLDQLAQKTGMSVEYEKSAPRQAVTLTVEDRTPAQAIVAILDELNIPYALSLTADGTGVQTLVIADSAPPPKGARARVGRETSMTSPDEAPAPEAPPQDQPETAAPPEVLQEQPQPQVPQPAPTQRRVPPGAPPVTLPPAFPNSPFGATRPEPQPEAPPAQPQAEKDPNV